MIESLYIVYIHIDVTKLYVWKKRGEAMRKLHINCAVITVFLFFFGCFFPFAVHSEAQKVIRVAGDNNFPPFEYLSDSGVYTGFNVDIMNAISIETGIRFEYYPMPWNEAVQAMRSGRVDAIQGMKYNQEREEIYDFQLRILQVHKGFLC